MTTIPPTRTGRKDNIPEWGASRKVPRQLLLQARLAATLLLCPWICTIFLCQPLFWHQPLSMVALLPGLMVAMYLVRLLFHHLPANHRYGERDQLFPTLGAANWITVLRACAIVALAGFLPVATQHDQGLSTTLIWAPGLIYLGISLADLFDGLIARKQCRETELGKRLDIETDAAGLMVATLLAVSLGRLPTLSLLVGLAYYLFIFGIWLRQRGCLPLVDLQSRPFSRIIAGYQMGLVGIAFLPIFNPVFTFAAAFIVMTPLLVGFARDWLVVSCRIHTDTDQQTAMDRWAGDVLIHSFPLVLRLIILTGGVLTLVGGDVFRVYPLWQWAQSFCCLFAGLGLMGRSAALLLVLLLSLTLSPFGTAAPALALFGAAATLMLTGTGPFSLWSPEENILYRRTRDGLEGEYP